MSARSYERIRLQVINGGFDGLYFNRECACELGDLFPCGEDASRIKANCKPGYKHTNPKYPNEFLIMNSKTTLTDEEFSGLIP